MHTRNVWFKKKEAFNNPFIAFKDREKPLYLNHNITLRFLNKENWFKKNVK